MGKQCSKCKQVKPLECYEKRKDMPDGVRGVCKECRNTRKRCKYRNGCCVGESERHAKRRQQEKLDAIKGYSPDCVCNYCGFDDLRALTIDHLNNDGAEHRRQIGRANIYRWLIRNNFPDGFQVLCSNCQTIKNIETLAAERQQRITAIVPIEDDQSNRHWVTYDGQTHTLVEWSRIKAIPYTALHNRVKQWGIERALTQPLKANKKSRPNSGGS